MTALITSSHSYGLSSITTALITSSYSYGLSSNTTAVITSDCGVTRVSTVATNDALRVALRNVVLSGVGISGGVLRTSGRALLFC